MEATIGHLKSKFAVLSHGLPYEDPIVNAKSIIVFCALHNYIKLFNYGNTPPMDMPNHEDFGDNFLDENPNIRTCDLIFKKYLMNFIPQK